MKTLSKSERTRYASITTKIKGIIDSVVKDSLELGQLLMTVREDGLFRDDYDSFPEYTQGEFGITQPRAQQLINFALEVAAADNHGYELPPNERAARELRKAPPEAKAAIMEEASKDGKPTAAKVAAAVRKTVQNDAPKPEKQKPAADAPPWAEFEAAVLEQVSILRGVSRRLGEIFERDSKTKLFAQQWAANYNDHGTVSAVNEIVRYLEDQMPAQLDAKGRGGFLTARQVKDRIRTGKAA